MCQIGHRSAPSRSLVSGRKSRLRSLADAANQATASYQAPALPQIPRRGLQRLRRKPRAMTNETKYKKAPEPCARSSWCSSRDRSSQPGLALPAPRHPAGTHVLRHLRESLLAAGRLSRWRPPPARCRARPLIPLLAGGLAAHAERSNGGIVCSRVSAVWRFEVLSAARITVRRWCLRWRRGRRYGDGTGLGPPKGHRSRRWAR